MFVLHMLATLLDNLKFRYLQRRYRDLLWAEQMKRLLPPRES